MQISSEILNAGDTWEWTESVSDYPATSYTLKCLLKYQDDATITLTATADGDDHDFTYAAASTASLTPGNYAYQITATKISDSTVTTIERGTVEIHRNLATISDERTHLETVRDAIKAVIESRATKEQESISIGGRAIQYMPLTDLVKLYRKYEQLVKDERKKELINQGLDAGNSIKIQFT